MKFSNVKLRKAVEVSDSEVELVTMKNGKKAAKVTYQGTKMFKILSKEDAERLGK
jgi:hypothetical protein